ncbi:MAG: hypothetical protein R2875_12740 [Desulfobacterales bacterium]
MPCYRTRAQGALIADVACLGGACLPCQRVSKENAFCAKGVRELLSLLKSSKSCGAYIDFERVNAIVEHGIENKDLAALKAWGSAPSVSLKRSDGRSRGRMTVAGLSIDGLTTGGGRRRLEM